MRRMNRIRRMGGCFAFAALLLGVMSGPCHALQLAPAPDVKGGALEVEYLAATGVFSARGLAEKYNMGAGFVDFSSLPSLPYFDLLASIGGGSLLGGILAIYDDLDYNDSFTTGDYLYLSGTLTSLQYEAGNPVLNFLFTPTGGLYAGPYQPAGGIIVGASGFESSADGFDSDFGSLSGNADVGTPVPEPCTVSLFLLGAGGISLFRRRRSRA